MDHTVDLSSKGARRRRIPMRVRFRAFRRHWASGFVFVVVFRIVLAIWPERPDWNPTREEIAISSLRMVVSSEIACREQCVVDEDGDGRGEYGGLREMAAHVRPRGRTDVVGVAPRVAVLLREFGEQVADGSLHDAGYRFRVFLASRSGGAVAETNTGFADGVVDPDLAEVRFVAYAWPDVRRKGAERTFVVTESGDVYSTDAAAYEGAAGPAAGAAMSSGTIDSIRGGIASGRRALDGNVWTRLP